MSTLALESSPHGERLRRMDISHATDLWLGELARLNHSDRTVDTYRRLLDKLAGAHSRHVDVDELTATHVRRFLDAQAVKKDGSRKSAATIAQNVTIVNNFFDWLTKEGIVARNPTRRNGDRIISRPPQLAPEENDNIVSVSSDEVRRLLHEADRLGRWNERLAVNCLVYLGPRRRAVAQALLSDYDQVERTLTFREKGSKTIRKPVPDKFADLIDAAIYAGEYKASSDYLIPGNAPQRRQGDRDDRVIHRLVGQVAARAGVTTHVHALRAAFAVHYLENKKGEVVSLRRLLGHARLETTLVYLRRLDRQQAMETVRDLSWDSPANSEEPLEALPVTEKEGFEPSFDPMLLLERDGSQHEADAPRDEART
jgi:site-specific recombinase XerD